MLTRCVSSWAVVMTLAVLTVVAPAPVAGQAAKNFTPIRMPWGDPNISGNFTSKEEMNTPLERPDEFAGKRIEDVTPQELAAAVRTRQRNAVVNAPYAGGGSRARGVALSVPIHWLDHLDAGNSRPWLVIDPPDGKVPPLTRAAQQRSAARAAGRRERGSAESYTDRGLWDRCVTFGVPSMISQYYGASFQILQTKDYVAIRYEMVHETRVIPIEGRGAARPHNPSKLRTYFGDATARWEGNTLVVDTANLNGKVGGYSLFLASDENLHLVERFTRTASNRVEVTTTVEDPTVWTRPWTYTIPLTENDGQPIFEYACHEGNYGLRNILSGARADEKNGVVPSDDVRIADEPTHE